jgi:uncharacterized protein YeaO (DUF488 family)
LQLEAWIRDLAPGTALRKKFALDPERWEQFKRRYFSELDDSPE